MIARLRGPVLAASGERLVVESDGVGWEVICAPEFVARQEAGAEAEVHCDLRITEGEVRLYGFASADERAAFRSLRGVSGVGARVAQSLIGGLGYGALVSAVGAGEAGPLLGVKGVGKRLAERIVAERRDEFALLAARVRGIADAAPGTDGKGAAPAARGAGLDGAPRQALTALLRLGYGRSIAEAALSQVSASGRIAARDASQGAGAAEEAEDAGAWVRAALAVLGGAAQ